MSATARHIFAQECAIRGNETNKEISSGVVTRGRCYIGVGRGERRAREGAREWKEAGDREDRTEE